MNSLPKPIFLDLIVEPSPSEKFMEVAPVLAAVALVALIAILIMRRKKKKE